MPGSSKVRSLVIPVLAVVVIALVMTGLSEVFYVVFFAPHGTRAHQQVNFVIFLVILAGSGIVTYRWLARSRQRNIHLLQQLVNNLSGTGGLAECAEQLASFIYQIMPGSRVVVNVLNPNNSHLEAQAVCERDGKITFDSSSSVNTIVVEKTLLKDPDEKERNASLFQIPLVVLGRKVGLAAVEAPVRGIIQDEQRKWIDSAAQITAQRIDLLLQDLLAKDPIDEIDLQRRRIAQDLHDTLAQNIGYLRLKLDQLTCQPPPCIDEETGKVLERMHTTAEEAYEQVRDLLDNLNPKTEDDLRQSLWKLAQAICQRSGLKLRFNQIGLPYTIPVNVHHQVQFVAREALYNIEKHAGAEQVALQLVWLEEEIILKITDDGCGFDPPEMNEAGHYGLWIMEYRARELGGGLKVTRAEEGHGTEVTLWVPRHQDGYGREISIAAEKIRQKMEIRENLDHADLNR